MINELVELLEENDKTAGLREVVHAVEKMNETDKITINNGHWEISIDGSADEFERKLVREMLTLLRTRMHERLGSGTG